MTWKGKTRPPKEPERPETVDQGVSAIQAFVIQRFDRRDGTGVDWVLVVEALFQTAFLLLGRAQEDRRRRIAASVHADAYDRLVESAADPQAQSKREPSGGAPKKTFNMTMDLKPR